MDKQNEVYLFSVVEVEIKPKSFLSQEVPNAKGAFIDVVVVPAGNGSEAETKLKEALFEDGYKLISYEQLGKFSEFEWEDEQQEVEYKAMAWDAYSEGLISYGIFHSWSEDEDK